MGEAARLEEKSRLRPVAQRNPLSDTPLSYRTIIQTYKCVIIIIIIISIEFKRHTNRSDGRHGSITTCNHVRDPPPQSSSLISFSLPHTRTNKSVGLTGFIDYIARNGDRYFFHANHVPRTLDIVHCFCRRRKPVGLIADDRSEFSFGRKRDRRNTNILYYIIQ